MSTAGDSLQDLCAAGQELLMQMQYLQAERALAEAEEIAWNQRDFDTLSRLYMPLQETRRQRRQRCAQGVIRLNLLANGPNDSLSPEELIRRFPQGILLVAGWETLAPASEVRTLVTNNQLFVDVFIASVRKSGNGTAISVYPTEHPRDAARCIQLSVDQLPADESGAMQLWERLHLPYLADADAESDPVAKMSKYRAAIAVDYACELAHQKLSDVAHRMRQIERRA